MVTIEMAAVCSSGTLKPLRQCSDEGTEVKVGTQIGGSHFTVSAKVAVEEVTVCGLGSHIGNAQVMGQNPKQRVSGALPLLSALQSHTPPNQRTPEHYIETPHYNRNNGERGQASTS